MSLQRRPGCRAFTLLEVLIAVLLLSLGLTALLQVQTRNIAQAGRARDLTVAVALARGKMVDLEQMLFHQGLTTGEVSDEGDFATYGHPEVRFHYQISEIEMDLSRMSEAVGAMAAKSGRDAQAAEGEFTTIFQAMSAIAGPFVETIARSLRVIDLEVSWPQGTAHPHLSFRSLVSQDDFTTMAAGDAMRQQRLGTDLQPPTGTQP